jgi:hypothetical protein
MAFTPDAKIPNDNMGKCHYISHLEGVPGFGPTSFAQY